MWGKNEPLSPPPAPSKAATPPPKPAEEPSRPAEVNGRAILGKSLVIKAQITGGEDLYIDGQLEGSVELKGHNFIVGNNGKVNANVTARNVIVHGSLQGNVQAAEKVEIRKTGSLQGDLTTAGVTIEDGAYFKGSIDIVKPQSPKGK